jgi:hypothetical protein
MRVLDFRAFHKINEAESEIAGAVDQLLNLFFQAYGGLVTKIGDYPDAVKDLMEIAKEKDPNKVGKVFLDILNKIAGKVDPKYKEAADQIVLAGKKMKDAYDSALKTEDGQKDLEKVKEGIYDRIIAYLASLKKVAEENPKKDIAKNDEEDKGKEVSESWSSEEQGLFPLFEKANTFRPEREEIASDLIPQLSLARDLAKNPASPSLGEKYKQIVKRIEDLLKEVAQENRPYWVDMSRRERLDRLEEIRNEVKVIKDDLVKVSVEGVKSLGLDKNITAKIKEATDLIAASIKLMGAVDVEEAAKKAEEAEKGKAKEEDKKDEEDNETFTEIKSGNKEKENLTKKGKNKDAIQKSQELINLILPEKEKIKADGLYGNNTEKAIKKIADMYINLAPDLLKDVDGKSLTPDFQKFLSKMEKNKDKVKDLFK